LYNLMTAAAAAGINRSTVLRAIKAGRISAQRDSNNGWEIDPAEFHRVFPPLPLTAAANAQPDAQQVDAQVALLRNMVELRKTIVDANKTCGKKATVGIRPTKPRNVHSGSSAT
jgi:hypothetical protein